MAAERERHRLPTAVDLHRNLLEGPSLDDVRTVAAAVKGRFLYAGGVGTLEHLRALRDLRQVNLSGVIVGKALYERRFTIAEAQAVLAGRD